MELFFCIACGKLGSIGQAAALFRTGYYRIHYRLGCCSACAAAADRGSADSGQRD
ncbi:hypothetical protein [Cohnella caldifontis]|uniref:hypothetical protein n=1 Tax=Cohnella caldifontis TaxID=3027471 RepID=UPI0023EC94D1|nr:hypothetical protein [Cohnella sp. YIM B05605]